MAITPFIVFVLLNCVLSELTIRLTRAPMAAVLLISQISLALSPIQLVSLLL